MDEFGPTSSFNAERYASVQCINHHPLDCACLLNTGLSHLTPRCGCLIFSVIVKPHVGT